MKPADEPVVPILGLTAGELVNELDRHSTKLRQLLHELRKRLSTYGSDTYDGKGSRMELSELNVEEIQLHYKAIHANLREIDAFIVKL